MCVWEMRPQSERPSIGLNGGGHIAEGVVDASQAVVRVGQIRFQSDCLAQSGSGGPPFLFRHEHETQLEMGVPVIRLQCNRRAAFLNRCIHIADTGKGSG